MADDLVPVAALADMLAPALGDVRAQEEVMRQLGNLGVAESFLTRQQAVSVLRAVGGEPGLVGIAARFAASRMLLSGG